MGFMVFDEDRGTVIQNIDYDDILSKNKQLYKSSLQLKLTIEDIEVCNNKCYNVVLYDKEGNGLESGGYNGWYQIVVRNGPSYNNVVADGRQFGFEAAQKVCIDMNGRHIKRGSSNDHKRLDMSQVE